MLKCPRFDGVAREFVFLENRPVFVKIRENAFFLILGGYGMVLVAWYAYNGVLFQLSLGLWALALLPITLVLGKATQFVRELTPILGSAALLRGAVGSRRIARNLSSHSRNGIPDKCTPSSSVSLHLL